jgi:hypothetical protein
MTKGNLIQGYLDDEDYPGKPKKKKRGFPSHLARAMARYDPNEPEPHFVCQDCKEIFKLNYMKVYPGTLTEDERNLCRDCYKTATAY